MFMHESGINGKPNICYIINCNSILQFKIASVLLKSHTLLFFCNLREGRKKEQSGDWNNHALLPCCSFSLQELQCSLLLYPCSCLSWWDTVNPLACLFKAGFPWTQRSMGPAVASAWGPAAGTLIHCLFVSYITGNAQFLLALHWPREGVWSHCWKSWVPESGLWIWVAEQIKAS